MRFACLVLGLALVGGIASAFDPATQDDSVALARHFEPPSNPVGPPVKEGSFDPLPGETVSLMGGSDVFRMQEFGFLESMLQSAFPSGELRVRNLGWPADTVHRQQRPMFFFTEKGDTREGSVPDLRERIDPGLLILCFGKMESIEGVDHLPDFVTNYERLLSALKQHSRRLVLVAPVPFAEAGPAAALAKERNQVLEAYRSAIATLAAKHEAVFIGMDPMPVDAFLGNGIQLSESGQLEFARRIAAGLGVSTEPGGEIVSVIRQKNHLWDQYFRPTNWAFLFGDRQHVPSSRDHEDSSRRWFVEELERIPGMIATRESEIWRLAEGGPR